MNSTFDIFSIKTVPPTYSWDQGVPGIGFTDFVTELSSCAVASSNSRGIEYVGYAPFTFVSLSSEPGKTLNNCLLLERTADFGDYYNSEYNLVTVSTLSVASLCHSYLMPGLYTIRFNRTEYVEAVAPTFRPHGPCFQKHCINWSWKSLTIRGSTPSVTWATASSGKSYEKKWKYEACDTDWASVNDLYSQMAEEKINKISTWQWYNFLGNSNKSVYNNPLQWSSTGFQQPSQVSWNESIGPCLDLGQTKQLRWTWNNVTVHPNPLANAITWDDTKVTEPRNTTWDRTQQSCIGLTTTILSSITQTSIKEAYVRVIEILPTAYLEVQQPNDRVSPITVKLSPSKIICGSFPIEKIVWDLGDGSPLLVQRRWSNTLEQPFVYSGSLSADPLDPRNYDIIHTYVKTSTTGFSFYPSITAYASSTGSWDCASGIVGPLKLNRAVEGKVSLIQTELTEHGKVLIGQVDNNVAIWRADK